jgi:hypothetical protein
MKRLKYLGIEMALIIIITAIIIIFLNILNII